MSLLKQTFIPHKNNSYRPHLIRRHGLLLVLLIVVGIQLISNLPNQSRGEGQVLGYASNITISGLLSSTNQQRAAAGKSTLSNSSKLNSAAQAKANHMITNNYWAHTAPDGTTPWYWFSWAGYSYLTAGENLAYGFDTSSGVINGWMNSPSHKANMLNGAFEDVGFGIANGANYQGGPNTVVVAMYGDPVASNPVPAPVTKQSSPTQTAEPQPAQEQQQAETKPKPKPEPIPKKETTETAKAEEDTTGTPEQPIEIAADEPKRISNFEALVSGQATWALYVVASLSLLIGFVYLYRHVLFIHKAVIKGERYLIQHPLLEASIIYALIWLLLSGTFGSIL